MKKLSAVILFSFLLAVLPCAGACAATLAVNNQSDKEFSLGYDSWFFGFKSSYTATIPPQTVTNVSVSFPGSFGEMRLSYNFYGKMVSGWAGVPSGVWLPTRDYKLLILIKYSEIFKNGELIAHLADQ